MSSSETPEGQRALAALIAHRETGEAARAGRATQADVDAAADEMARALGAYVGTRADLLGRRMRETARCRSGN